MLADYNVLGTDEGRRRKTAAETLANLLAKGGQRQDEARRILRGLADANTSPAAGRMLIEVAGLTLFVDGAGMPVHMPSASGATL